MKRFFFFHDDDRCLQAIVRAESLDAAEKCLPDDINKSGETGDYNAMMFEVILDANYPSLSEFAHQIVVKVKDGDGVWLASDVNVMA